MSPGLDVNNPVAAEQTNCMVIGALYGDWRIEYGICVLGIPVGIRTKWRYRRITWIPGENQARSIN